MPHDPPGLTYRKKQLAEARLERRRFQREVGFGGPAPTGSVFLRQQEARAERAVARQEKEARRRKGSLHSFTNDAAHGETIKFMPSEKTQRIRKIGY